MIDFEVPLDLEQSAKLALVAGALTAASFAMLLRGAWRRRIVKVTTALVATVLFAAHAVWTYGVTIDSWPVAHAASKVSVVAVVLTFAVAGALPFAGLVYRLLAPKRRAGSTTGPGERALHQPAREPFIGSVTRRQVALAVASSVPALAFGGAAKGFYDGISDPRLRRVTLRYPSLAPDLVGLKILQLSDLHLGFVRHPRDLARFFDRLGDRPDLVVFTGDVADDLALLEPALRLARDLSPRYGVFSSLGNHEHLHSASFARLAHRRAGVPLLAGEGARVTVGASSLYVAGADDPVRMHHDIGDFMRATVDASLRDERGESFKLLLSHRPEGFVAGLPHGVDLTLSGHTHGGQIGFNGKSAFERIWPDRYLWGAYRRGESQLYTTSGFGHWFPFREGCPTEAALVTLAG